VLTTFLFHNFITLILPISEAIEMLKGERIFEWAGRMGQQYQLMGLFVGNVWRRSDIPHK